MGGFEVGENATSILEKKLTDSFATCFAPPR